MKQLSLDLARPTWGGRRKGAGRPRGDRPRVPHRVRAPHRARWPVHVTLRARSNVPYLRADFPFQIVRDAIRDCSRPSFRVVHFSVQCNHLHLIVEAEDARRLSSGAGGLAVRIAKRLNGRLMRQGSVWDDRWHGHALKTPREVRNAVVYVLANYKKHETQVTDTIDIHSSAPWFEGWRDVARERLDTLRGGVDPPVWPAETWLGETSWRRPGAG